METCVFEDNPAAYKKQSIKKTEETTKTTLKTSTKFGRTSLPTDLLSSTASRAIRRLI